MDWVAVEAISHFTTSSCSGLAAVFVAQADEAGVLGAHIFLDKTIESGLRVRKHSVRRRRDRCAHLPWDCVLYRHSRRSTRVFDVVIVLLFSNGLIFWYLGILGEYIGQMFREVKARPSFIVERTINLERTQRSD
jgi:hypothetical protein